MKIQRWLFKILKKQNVTDARTDNVKTVYPPQTKFAGGIDRKMAILDQIWDLTEKITCKYQKDILTEWDDKYYEYHHTWYIKRFCEVII